MVLAVRAVWQSLSPKDFTRMFTEDLNFVLLREKVLSGEVLLSDTPEAFQKTLSEVEAQESKQRDHEKLARETKVDPCPLCRREAVAASESGPHEMGGSPDWQAVSCYHCGLSVRKYAMLEAKTLWNRLPR